MTTSGQSPTTERDDELFDWAIRHGFALLEPDDWRLAREAMEMEKECA